MQAEGHLKKVWERLIYFLIFLPMLDLICVGLILLEFPCELVSAVVAGKWAASSSPFKPWMVAFRVRLLMAAATTTIVSLLLGFYKSFPLSALHIDPVTMEESRGCLRHT